MTIKKEDLIALYGTDNVDEIVKIKTKNRQNKVFTSRKPKRVEMTVDECKKLCAKVGLEYLDGYEGRVIEHVITDETVDRDGDIMRAKGCDFKTNYYPKNPTILFAHEGRNFPVGKSIKVWCESSEKNIKSQGLYFDDRMDRTGRADTVFRMVAGGGMPACSVGFDPHKANRPRTEEERDTLGLGEYGIEFETWELLEYSPCPVGSNPNALQNMLKAIKTKEDCQKVIDTIIPKEMIDDFIKAAQKEYEDFTATVTNVSKEKGTPLEIAVKVTDKVSESFEKVIDAMVELTIKISELNSTLEPLKDLRVGDSDDKSSGSPPKDKKSEDLYKCFEEEGNAIEL